MSVCVSLTSCFLSYQLNYHYTDNDSVAVLLCVFQTDETLCKVDAVIAAVGQDEDIVYSKSTSLQVYEYSH